MFVLLKQRTSNKLCDFHKKVWFVSSCKHGIVEFLYRRALPCGFGLMITEPSACSVTPLMTGINLHRLAFGSVHFEPYFPFTTPLLEVLELYSSALAAITKHHRQGS